MSYLTKYKEIADQNGFEFTDNREVVRVFGSDNGNMVRTEYVVMKKDDDVIYYAYDMFAPKAYMGSTYSGFYTVIHSVPSELTCKITTRINPVLDILLLGWGKKTGDKFIDKKLFIKTDDIDTIKDFITKDIVEDYMKLDSIIETRNIVFGKGEDILPHIPKYKDEIIAGIQTVRWVEPGKLIDTFNACYDIVKKIHDIRKV